MPWTARDAPKHTHHADTPEKRHRWATVANNALKEYDGDEGRAVRTANASVEPKKKNNDAFVLISKLVEAFNAQIPVKNPALKALQEAMRRLT